jgi:hypothetical protein
VLLAANLGPPPEEAAREKPLAISPERLAATWPTLLGKRVRFKAAITQALDPTRVLIRAGGRQFILNLPPERIWTGTKTHVFQVLGAGLAPVHGRTAMVELMLDDD